VHRGVAGVVDRNGVPHPLARLGDELAGLLGDEQRHTAEPQLVRDRRVELLERPVVDVALVAPATQARWPTVHTEDAVHAAPGVQNRSLAAAIAEFAVLLQEAV